MVCCANVRSWPRPVVGLCWDWMTANGVSRRSEPGYDENRFGTAGVHPRAADRVLIYWATAADPLRSVTTHGINCRYCCMESMPLEKLDLELIPFIVRFLLVIVLGFGVEPLLRLTTDSLKWKDKKKKDKKDYILIDNRLPRKLEHGSIHTSEVQPEKFEDIKYLDSLK